MDHRKDILTAIRVGMKQACTDMLYFTDDPAARFNAEYLFTVAVARAINDHNYIPAHAYEIRIEHSTRKLAKNCLLPMLRGDPMVPGSTVFRPKIPPKIQRSGRVDVAVYYDAPRSAYLGKQPLCAIEVKGFDPSRLLVLEDLRRNLEFLRVKGPTGGSVLGFSAFAALHNAPLFDDLSAAATSEMNVKQKYHDWLSELGQLSDIETKIETFTVSYDASGRISDEGEEKVVDLTSRHHFVGVIVTFSNRPLLQTLAPSSAV